jgi:hypothetical protein
MQASPRKAMATTKKKKPAKAKAVRKPPKKAPSKPVSRTKARPAPKPTARPAAKAAPGPKAAPETKARPEPKGKAAGPEKTALAVKGKPGEVPAKPAAPARPARKASRRPSLIRRGPDGEILAPGDLLLPGGAQRAEEVLYLFRGCAAAEHPVGEEAMTEVLAKRPEGSIDREELLRAMAWARERFDHSSVEPSIPPRAAARRTFQGVVERAKQRRREIGAFLRGLDLGHTESSHMDAHGEASLTSLMKLAAGLENLAEAEEPAQTDANELHRVFEQLEAATETLIVDVEQTLRRLRDRVRA